MFKGHREEGRATISRAEGGQGSLASAGGRMCHADPRPPREGCLNTGRCGANTLSAMGGEPCRVTLQFARQRDAQAASARSAPRRRIRSPRSRSTRPPPAKCPRPRWPSRPGADRGHVACHLDDEVAGRVEHRAHVGHQATFTDDQDVARRKAIARRILDEHDIGVAAIGHAAITAHLPGFFVATATLLAHRAGEPTPSLLPADP